MTTQPNCVDAARGLVTMASVKMELSTSTPLSQPSNQNANDSNSDIARGGHGLPIPENVDDGERRTNNWVPDSSSHKVQRV